MKYKIGIFGSGIDEAHHSRDTIEKLGKALADSDVILITGAGKGLPQKIISAAYTSNKNIEIWGFSPYHTLKSQQQGTPEVDTSIFQKLIFVPTNYHFRTDIHICRKYRNVTSTATCDAGIIISGRWGTLNEFTNLHDMGKVIGILIKSGGISDELFSLTKKIVKESSAKVLFDDSPLRLVSAILKELDYRNQIL